MIHEMRTNATSHRVIGGSAMLRQAALTGQPAKTNCGRIVTNRVYVAKRQHRATCPHC